MILVRPWGVLSVPQFPPWERRCWHFPLLRKIVSPHPAHLAKSWCLSSLGREQLHDSSISLMPSVLFRLQTTDAQSGRPQCSRNDEPRLFPCSWFPSCVAGQSCPCPFPAMHTAVSLPLLDALHPCPDGAANHFCAPASAYAVHLQETSSAEHH